MYLNNTYRQHTMKTLVVLTALVAVALAGPTSRATDLDITKEKRSPTLDHLQHLLPSPSHLLPVHHHQHHQPYVQPIIPHHLGLKKPIIVSQPYGHHIFRSDDEEQDTHSTEAKESKKTCMKEMEAKCEDEVSAKSSESDNNNKMEDIDASASDGEVAMSLKMAKEAVDTLQRKLELAEKNPKMAQWKHGNSEADGNMHENVETAKQALEHMQRNFGNLESMNVHARQFKNAEVHDANLKVEHVFKDSKDLKSDEERLAQWKNAIENIKKNVELVRNIEDSFQQNEHSEKSAAIDQSLNHKLEQSSDLKRDAILPKEESDKRTSDMKMSQDVEKMSADGKSRWQAHEHEKMRGSGIVSQSMEKKSLDGKSSWQAREDKHSFNSKNEMEASASTMSESKTTLHKSQHENEKALQSDNGLLEKSSDFTSASAAEHNELNKVIKPVESISQPTLKTSEDMEMKQAKQAHIEIEMDPPMVDTTNFMKSAEHNQAEEHKQIEHHSSHGHVSHQEHAMSSHDHHKMAEQHQAQQSSHMGNGVGSHLDHQKALSSPLNDKEVHEMKLEKTQKGLENILDQHKSSIPATHAKEAHDTMMKPSDQFTGQSQVTEVAVKPQQPVTSGHHSENLHHALSHGAHGKSAEGGSMFAPIGMNSDFKEALVPMKSWKEAQSARGAYGVGAALAGASSYGSGRGSGAVGVFPNAHVGGCAIPLLLSCSPSVVAGHLAKSHSYAAPSYGASAYRGSEQLSSPSKRDITKISRSAQIKKSPYNKDVHQKTVFITDKL